MRSSIVKGVMLSLALAVFFASPAAAQNRATTWELMPYFGYFKFSDEALLEDAPAIGLRFGYHWSKRHMIEFGFSGCSTETTDDAGVDLDEDLLGGQVNYVYNIFLHHRDKVVAFATAGVGILAESSFGFVDDPELVGEENYLSYNYGAGIRFFGSEKVGFRIDVRQLVITDARIDDVYLEVAAGVTLILGGT